MKSIRREYRTFMGQGHFPTLVTAFLYFDISFAIWVMLGPLSPFIVREFNFTATENAILVATPLLCGSMFRLVLGFLSDQIGEKKTAIMGMLATVIPLLWGWLGANSYYQILSLGFLLGISGASFAVALPMASRWYPTQYQGTVLGVVGAGNSGTVLALLLAPRLAARYGWHTVMGLAIFPLMLVLVLFLAWSKNRSHMPRINRTGSYLQALKVQDTLSFSLLYTLTFGGFVGMVSLLPILFVDQYNFDPVKAGLFTTICTVAGSFVRPVGGFLADRLGGVRLLKLLLGVMMVAMLGAAQLPSSTTFTALLVVGLTTMGLGNGAIFQLIGQRFPEGIGTITGIVGAAGSFGGYLLPLGIGLARDITGTYATALYVFTGMIGLLLILVIQKQAVWQTWSYVRYIQEE